MTTSNGFAFPVPGKSPADQYRAALDGCALVDLSNRDQIELTGADRAGFLHNFCTQEIKKLPAGSGAEAFLTSIKGRVLGHILVFVGEQAIWLDTVPGSAVKLVQHLDRYLITEDVRIHDRSSEWGELALIGPEATGIVDTILPGSGTMPLFQHGHADGITIRRFSFTSQPGWLIGTTRSALPKLAERLVTAGAIPCSEEVFHALRIEAGFPIYGVDLTEDNLAQEAGRTRQAISFTKGCYLGQEPIARIDALGHTNRELRGLRFSEAAVPPVGGKVLRPETSDEIGTITSSALSPVDNRAVALAMLRREAGSPEATVAVLIDSVDHAAKVFRQ